MSNASLKEQLQAVASVFAESKPAQKTFIAKKMPHKPFQQVNKVEKKPRPKWLDYVLYGVDLLKLHFPACFKSGNEIKPLKVKIKQDLLAQLSKMDTIVTDDKACMIKSLVYYVNTMAYYRSVVENAARIDLEGNVAGNVTKEEVEYTQERLNAKKKARETAK